MRPVRKRGSPAPPCCSLLTSFSFVTFPQTERVPLASVMTLIPKYFPPELYIRRAQGTRNTDSRPASLGRVPEAVTRSPRFPCRGKNKAALAQLAGEASWAEVEGKAGDDLMRLERLMARWHRQTSCRHALAQMFTTSRSRLTAGPHPAPLYARTERGEEGCRKRAYIP